MRIDKLSFSETGKFSQLFIDYLNSDKKLAPLIKDFPSMENLNSAATSRDFSKVNRLVLQKVLQQQYASLMNRPEVDKNILALEYSNVYTVTTGHQLNIFTGPLYFIYKIITTINLAKSLNTQYPDKYFVPIYWMASEDHDFEEISYFHLFGKKYQWETQQKGAVGRFRPESMSQVLSELPEAVELFEKAYLDCNTLAQSVRQYVHELFGKDGLLVVDADHKDLKQQFIKAIKEDVFENTASQKLEHESEFLTTLGYSPQINAREINFFYLKDNIRERIVREGGEYLILNTDLRFSRASMEAEIDKFPERFSPNVVMRPLYQETILPNIAYIGGPSELAYWFQLKGIFDHHQTPFPILIPRNFALYITHSNSKKLKNLQIQISDLFKDKHELKSIQLKYITENELDISENKREIAEAFKNIATKAEAIDKSLVGFIGATHAKIAKELDNIEKRLKKAEEKNQESYLAQVDQIQEKLFPHKSLQERHDNFLNFYLNDKDFLEKISSNFNPLDFRFVVIIEE